MGVISAQRAAARCNARPSTRHLLSPNVREPLSQDIVDPEFDEFDPDDMLTGVGLDHLYQGNGQPIHFYQLQG